MRLSIEEYELYLAVQGFIEFQEVKANEGKRGYAHESGTAYCTHVFRVLIETMNKLPWGHFKLLLA